MTDRRFITSEDAIRQAEATTGLAFPRTPEGNIIMPGIGIIEVLPGSMVAAELDSTAQDNRVVCIPHSMKPSEPVVGQCCQCGIDVTCSPETRATVSKGTKFFCAYCFGASNAK